MHTGILDVSHWEYDSLRGQIEPALARCKAAGITAVIAKATQGKDYVDPSWPKWARAIVDAGLLLGAYHFGSSTAPGDAQADWFLKALAAAGVDVSQTLLSLDLENNPNPAWLMGACDARMFMHRLHARTGQRPTLYGSNQLTQFKTAGDLLGEFPLWIAAYGPTAPKLPKAWGKYALFQYTNGKQGPRDTTLWPRSTAGYAFDRSAYPGTAEAMRAAWPQL